MIIITRLVIALLISLVAMPVLAADPEPQLPTKAPDSAAPQSGQVRALGEDGSTLQPVDPVKAIDPLDTTSPMMMEIRTTMELSRGQIAELAVRASNTTGHNADLAIQQEIATIKQQTELDILSIQARFARADGNEELAKQIETAIATIISPPVPEAPTVPRIAPDNRN